MGGPQSEDIGAKKSDVRIQFINLLEYSGSKPYPMGLLYVSAYLKKHGFTNLDYIDYLCLRRDVRTYDGYQIRWPEDPEEDESDIVKMLRHLYARKPHVVFIGSVTTPSLVELIDLVPRLRERHPDIILLAGGPHFGKDESMDLELIRDHCRGLDGIIVGEGEETATEIVEEYFLIHKNKSSLPKRSDFSSRLEKIHGVLTQTGLFHSRKLPNLNSMPFPDMELLEEYWKNPRRTMYYKYSLSERRNPKVGEFEGFIQEDFDWGSYFESIHYFDRFMDREADFPFGIVIGSRCCPYNCAFCSSMGERRLHTPQHVFDQMVQLHERFGIRLFMFFDPLFTLAAPDEQNRVEKLCELLLNSELDCKYIIDVRADVILGLREELLVKMIRSGCAQFNFGMEKGSNRALRRLTKGIKVEDHHTALERLRKISEEEELPILLNGTFILGGPGETKEDVRETLLHAFSLDLDALVFYQMQIHPGTRVYDEAVDEGLLDRGLAPYLNAKEYPIFVSDEVTESFLYKTKLYSEKLLSSTRDMKNCLRKIESQLKYREGHLVTALEVPSFRESYGIVRRFLVEALDFLRRNPNESLFEEEEITSTLKPFASRVYQEIERLESQLLKEYPNYDPSIGHYRMGTLLSEWENVLIDISDLFDYENFI